MKRTIRLFALTAFISFGSVAAFASELFFVASKSGLLTYRLDEKTGSVTNVASNSDLLNPGFLAIHPNHQQLYSLNGAMIDGKRASVISALSIDRSTGNVTLLNHQKAVPSAGPTHLDVDHEGKNVLVANYGGGSVSVFPINTEGKLGASSAFIQHKGSSVVPKRQEGPHAHHITTDVADHFAFVCDLGLDQVLVYKLNTATGEITNNRPAFASLKPGSGPRHLAFSPNGKFAYVINELNSTMTVFSYDAKAGVLKEVQSISTLPKDFEGKNYPAEVAVHPSGKFVYGSNRGHDSIVIYSVDQKTGKLTVVDYAPVGGKAPRQFEVNPTGTFLIAGNQESNTMVTFRIDEGKGTLTATATNSVEAPMCIKFVPQ